MVGPELPDLIAGLVSLIALVGFVQFWKPKYRPEFEAVLVPIKNDTPDEENVSHKSSSINEQNDSFEKDRTKAVESKDATQVETEDGELQGSEAANKNDIIPIRAVVVKPNAREILLAWSPWVLIVCVVIM